MLRNQDEDQLKEILSSTFTNNNYIDEEIEELFMTNQQPFLKPVESSESQRSSEMSESSLSKQILSSGLYLQPMPVSSFSEEEKVVEKVSVQVVRSMHIFDEFYHLINRSLKPQSLEQVRFKYPLFLLSQPNSEIGNHIKQINLTYSGGLLKKNVLVIDAGYCEQQKVYKIAVGTDEGNVIIFQPNSSKPQQVIVCFNKICMITSVKWSKNMQYLAISNDEKEVYVYAFKQAIHIQNQVSYRLLKSPIQYCYLNEKQLKNIVVQLYFVQEVPFQMLLVTENDEIIRLQMKRHIINHRPHLTPLPYQMSNFLDISLLSVQDTSNASGVLMAVSGFQFVTLCLLCPSFEIIMVYDKQKHGGKIKKNGFPSVSFRQQPSSMMVIWDKYLEIISLNIESCQPLKYTFAITHKFLLPDSTIIGGFLSNSMVYQVTRVGVKVYSVTKFQEELSNKYESDEVLCHKINFQNFCYGERIEQAIGNSNIELQDLRYLKGLFIVTNRTLFFSTNKGVEMIYFSTMHQYVTYLVQNNNWKTALQILKNCYTGAIYQLDQILPEIIRAKIRQFSSRYINFLETVILSDLTSSTENNILLLWNQELIFIFNILILTHQDSYLLEEIIPKIYKLNPTYITNIIPFVLTNRLTKVTCNALQIFFETIPKQCLSKLIFNLQPNNNDLELPHQINNLLIRHGMYLEFVDLNQKFRDHYTSIAVLLGLYLKLQQDNDRNIMELTDQKSKIGKLIAYSVHDTLYSINFNKYDKQQNKEILQSTLPLVIDQIFQILIKQQPIGLFQNILEQLYMGNCLQTLNQLDLVEGEVEIMQKIVESIPYDLVLQFKCEKRYWIAVLKLFARRIIDIQIFSGLKYLCIEDHVEVQYIQKFTSKCGQLIIKELASLSVGDLNNFFDRLLQTSHICLIKLVGKLLNRFIDVIDALFCQESQRNMKIYEYLDECLPRLSAPQIQKLRIILKENIKLLTFLDPNRASDIICKYYLPDLNLFIDDLNDFQTLQTKLIHAVLQLYSYKESLYSLKIKYLELLAIAGHHETILQEIMKENFPLDQSLHICKKYEVLEAYAYLLVRSGGSGNTETAIKVYFRIIWQKIIKVVVVNHGAQCRKQLQGIIMKNVGECIKVCMELDLKHYQTEWFTIMQQLQALKKNIFRNLVIDAHTCETLKIIINKQAYPQLIKMLIVEVSYENIISHLKVRLSTFDLEAVQIVIDEMVKNYLYERRMFVVSQNIFINTENMLRKSLLNAELLGFCTQDRCHVCEQRGGLLVHYKCGHQIHPSCGQDVRECILCKELQQVIYTKKMDLMEKVKVQIYSGGLPEDLQEVEIKMEKEKKLKRMTAFDEMSRISFNDYQLL